MSPTTETCACGASITLGINDSTDIGWRLGEWRKGHRHDLDAAYACRERDEAHASMLAARAARPGWPSALDALEAAQEGNDRLGAMVEWLAEVIVDARDACQRAESIEPSGSPEWVESGIAMRTTVLREVRAILDRERTAHPSALDKVTDRAEKAETEITALRERVADLEGQLAMRGTP